MKLGWPEVGEIIIGSDLMGSVGFTILPSLKPDKVHVITDQNVASHHLVRLQSSFSQAGLLSTLHIIDPGEHSKNFKVLGNLTEEVLSYTPTCNSVIVALGGGMVGDIAGIVANLVLRGIRLVHIPTTLLAQVDSAIGGKCAVNSKHGKNLIGVYSIPKLVFIDISLLQTLPDKDFTSGCAEVVKYAMLYDAKFFSWIQENLQRILARENAALSYVVKRCCQMKLEVMRSDQFSTNGSRDMLNFGHTIAHAIESSSQYSVLHGEAVSVGMVMESSISDIDNSSMKENLQKAGLPISLEDIRGCWDCDLLYSHILRDKKVVNNTIKLTFLEKIGQAYTDYVSCDFMRHLLDNSLN